jgi:hypothetical protein
MFVTPGVFIGLFRYKTFFFSGGQAWLELHVFMRSLVEYSRLWQTGIAKHECGLASMVGRKVSL